MKKPTRKQALVLVGLLLLLLLAGAATHRWRRDRQVARAKELQRELFGQEGRNLSPEERGQKRQELRQVRQKMTPAQRRELTAEMRKRQRERMARYFALSAAEKEHYLDDQIQRMEEARQARQAAGGGPPGSSGGGGPPGGEQRGGWGRSAAERDQRRQARLDSTTPEERAQFTQFMRDLSARRAQLGLPTRGGLGPGR
jgi:hypothetical protein